MSYSGYEGDMVRLVTTVLLSVIGILTFVLPAAAYPVFQEWSQKNSGRAVDCAMCHTNPHGPSGTGDGQLGSLTDEQLEQLNEARGALEAGRNVDNPVLNEFGNHIIEVMGRSGFLRLMNDPGRLVSELGTNYDLDDDGIPDSVEYEDGTDPLNRHHGDPFKLFVVNLNRSKFEIGLAALSVFAILYGLYHFLRGAAYVSANSSGQNITAGSEQ